MKALQDDAALVAAVRAANLPTLALVMVHLSGDPGLMRRGLRFKRASGQRMDGGLDEAKASELRAQALELLRAHRDAGSPALPLPSAEVLHEMMSFSLGQPVPPEYAPMMVADMRRCGLGAEPPRPSDKSAPTGFRAIVIGAGPSGMLASIELSRMGVAHTVIEKNAEIGGTWLENSYPGCRVDLPSHFYAMSFEPNASWSGYYAPRDEILTYLKGVADKHRVRHVVRFETEVVRASYDEARALWRVVVRDGSGESTLEANVLISAVGQLNRPALPELRGLERFGGPAFHSARWRHDIDLRGKRVGIVGTGASSMQIVPRIAPEVGRVVIFQRSAQWAIPNPSYFAAVSPGERWLLEHVPYYAPWYRFRTFYTSADMLHESLQLDPSWPHPERSLNADNDRIRTWLVEHIERELGGRQDLLEKCIPDYPPFAKRMLLDSGWFKTLTRDNVALVTEAISEVTERGVQLASGEDVELDVLVFATGFQATRFLWPMTIAGVGGRTLEQAWAGDPRAHLGITVPGFPSFFMLYGPNTNLAHGGSIVFHSECQTRYIAECLRLLFEGGYASLECTEQAYAASNERLDAAQSKMAWAQPSVRNWYRSEAGRIASTSPYRLVDYWAMTQQVDPRDFVLHRLAGGQP